MPRYNLRLGSSTVTLANTSQPISQRLFNDRELQTRTDSGGTIGKYNFRGQDLDRDRLREVKEIRESGGLVAWLFEAKALMKFGTGAELQSENDDLEQWLNEEAFTKLDLTVLDLGEDATWFPYGLGEIRETRGGDFSHYEFIEPWTMLPQTDEYGDIQFWEQETQDGTSEPFQTDEIGSIILNKASARDKVGVSEVLRSEEEITQYKENQRAVNKAIEIAGFPHHVWTVGAEGQTPINDNDLRRVRNLIDNMDGDTQFVVGPDVDHDKITPADFDFESITRRDLRMLTTTVGLPLEMAGYGREGLGSGSETDLIGDLLALQNEVSRRRFETQFIEEFVRPVVRDYSPYDPDENINLVINPFLDERDTVASLIEKIGAYMTNAEVRDRLDLPPLEDEELAESYRSPEAIEEAEEGDGGGDDPFGGMFGEAAEDAVDAELDKRDLEGDDLALVDDATPDFDRHYLRLLETGPYSDGDGVLMSFSDSGVPEMVQERIIEAINGGALFSQFDEVPSSKLMEMRQVFADQLTDDGWTTSDLTTALQDFEPSLDEDEAERIARTEVQSVVNHAREDAYLDRDLEDDRFKWLGTQDTRTTLVCEWLKGGNSLAGEGPSFDGTNPKYGGTPVTLPRMKELIQDANNAFVDHDAREFTPHIQCRHTFVRHVE